ncbi:MAG TPA: hypothetical protein VMW24_19545 [Sedimentisphaerales bacterium]|nr:hypothetical protein [Sedimentisphaerales bacterium]
MSELKAKIFGLAERIVQESHGAIRLAHHEEDGTEKVNKEAAHFLKVHDQRLGRDLELYALMAELTGVGVMLTHLLSEIVYRLREHRSAYLASSEYLRHWGLEVFKQDQYNQWNELFETSEAGQQPIVNSKS